MHVSFPVLHITTGFCRSYSFKAWRLRVCTGALDTMCPIIITIHVRLFSIKYMVRSEDGISPLGGPMAAVRSEDYCAGVLSALQ